MVNELVVNLHVPATVALIVRVALSAIAGAAKAAASSEQRIVFFMAFPFLPSFGCRIETLASSARALRQRSGNVIHSQGSVRPGAARSCRAEIFHARRRARSPAWACRTPRSSLRPARGCARRDDAARASL